MESLLWKAPQIETWTKIIIRNTRIYMILEDEPQFSLLVRLLLQPEGSNIPYL